MTEIASRDLPITRKVLPRNDAVEYFKSIKENYKAEIIESIPADQEVSLYSEGEFTDLCRGPHVPSTGKLKVFKLMKVAGAYWRGDSKNEMLQRIYGTAWTTKEDLQNHLFMLEEAEKRDHRKLGKQLDLFHMQDEAPGMVFGILRDGRFGKKLNITCERCSWILGIKKLKHPRSWIRLCGKNLDIGKIIATTCLQLHLKIEIMQ
jgi:threonyl-tRNA synthetase